MNVFKRVGQQVAFGEALVGLDDVRPIHDLAMTDVMLAANVGGKNGSVILADGWDKVAYSFYFRPPDEFEYGSQDRHVTIQTVHFSAPDCYRLAVSLRTYSQQDRYSNKLVRFSHEVVGGEVVQAKKAVYLVLGSAAVFAGPESMYEQITTERKTYERQMTAEDCAEVTQLLAHTANRAAIRAA